MNCSQQCIGHCRDGTFCNHVTGYCDRGCNTGWMGFICEKRNYTDFSPVHTHTNAGVPSPFIKGQTNLILFVFIFCYYLNY